MTHDVLAPTAIAVAIEKARIARGLSVRHAADLAEMSEGRWRQIAKGYQQMAGGHRAPVNAPVATLSRMCSVVGLTGEQVRALKPRAEHEQRRIREVAGLLETHKRVAAMRQLPPFGLLDDDDELFRRTVESHVLGLQERVESLEAEVADLREALVGLPSEPKHSSGSDGD